jgi:[Skp1-protein]-hydroxyproline N-acetylglucosaminyltransferase
MENGATLLFLFSILLVYLIIYEYFLGDALDASASPEYMKAEKLSINASPVVDHIKSLVSRASDAVATTLDRRTEPEGKGFSTTPASLQDKQTALADKDCGSEFPEFEYPKVPLVKNTIFVSIASYRDEACKNTVYDLFDKAEFPDQIVVGVVQQNEKTHEKEDCFDKCQVCKSRKESGHIKVINLDYTQAKGPAYARFIASSLWYGQEFYLQVDSHTKFEKHWDTNIIKQWRELEDPKGVLGHYPPTDQQMKEFKEGKIGTTYNCSLSFAKTKLPSMRASIAPAASVHERKAVPQKYVGANFLFFPAIALYEVPYDPYLIFVFFPEEIVFSARLWTHGYNMYAPHTPVCTHNYEPDPNRPRFWDNLRERRDRCEARAETRAEFLLGARSEQRVDKSFRVGLDKYGMGKERSLSDYWKFAKLNLHKKSSKSSC